MSDDPYLWLEDIDGADAMQWVHEQNESSVAHLESAPLFAEIRSRIAAALTSPDRIPGIQRRGAHFYNVWRDQHHPRGLLRRTTLEEFRQPSTAWEDILDLDALAVDEGENWVLGGMVWLDPQYDRVLLKLSRGGADATVVREFDIPSRSFVEDGFVLPEAKCGLTWVDRNELLVWTDFGPGTLTNSGYPRQVRSWRRGQPLAEAQVLFEAEAGDIRVAAARDRTPGFERTVIQCQTDFFRNRSYQLDEQRRPQRFDKPDDATIGFWREWLMVSLRGAWALPDKTWASGSVLMCKVDAYMRGERKFQCVFEPSPTRSLAGVSLTATRLLLVVQEDLISRLEVWTTDGEVWSGRAAPPMPLGTLGIAALHDPLVEHDPLAESYFQVFSGPLTPETLSLCDAANGRCEPLKALPPMFDASGLAVELRRAVSKDGTSVPYTIIRPKAMKLDGSNPTLLYGYGGFQVAQRPGYAAMQGIGWLERGGVYVVAHIRGGGEFGPTWHQTALRENRQRSFDDFIAVAEHLIKTGVTSPKHLGIRGESNGGLLVTTVMTQRPDLFRAVLGLVPLTDMRRYHLLLAGASWMAEYGDPENPADWAFLERYSPYQNARPKTDADHPSVFLLTSTRDDRVHPGHARKLAARLIEFGHEVRYFENIEGGHGGAANSEQRAYLEALGYAFLWERLAG